MVTCETKYLLCFLVGFNPIPEFLILKYRLYSKSTTKKPTKIQTKFMKNSIKIHENWTEKHQNSSKNGKIQKNIVKKVKNSKKIQKIQRKFTKFIQNSKKIQKIQAKFK